MTCGLNVMTYVVGSTRPKTDCMFRRRLQNANSMRRRLSAIVGTETGRVLQVAHEAAHDLVTKAEHRAEELLYVRCAFAGRRAQG